MTILTYERVRELNEDEEDRNIFENREINDYIHEHFLHEEYEEEINRELLEVIR